MDNKITFRQATSADAVLLADIGRRAFEAAFGPDNKADDMAAYLDGAFSEETQAGELAQKDCIFIIAETEKHEPIGYSRLQPRRPPTCITGQRPVEIVRFYMLPDWIGKGTGSQLMQKTLETARGGGYDVVWLSTWQKNARGLKFYEKWGFTIVGEQTFQLGSDPQSDWILQRSLG